MNCQNCGKKTYNKFCDIQCKNEYHLNIHLTQAQANVLMVLRNRRGWVSMEYNSTVYGMMQRKVPLLVVRNVHERSCEVCILPDGDRFLELNIANVKESLDLTEF